MEGLQISCGCSLSIWNKLTDAHMGLSYTKSGFWSTKLNSVTSDWWQLSQYLRLLDKKRWRLHLGLAAGSRFYSTQHKSTGVFRLFRFAISNWPGHLHPSPVRLAWLYGIKDLCFETDFKKSWTCNNSSQSKLCWGWHVPGNWLWYFLNGSHCRRVTWQPLKIKGHMESTWVSFKTKSATVSV